MAIFERGQIVGDYLIVEALGMGGRGEVYRADDTRRGRTVAVKVLPQQLSSTAKLKSRFEDAARTISQLSHPNIGSLYEVHYEKDVGFLVTEFLEGETLSERLKKGPLPQDQAIGIALEITDALDYAHREGIIHRDLKPGNIMLTDTGTKLMDFGLLLSVDEGTSNARQLTSAGSIIGTLEHMSPEQIEGLKFDARSDIFSLGTVLFEMLTGKPPFQARSTESIMTAILKEKPPPPGITPHLDWIVTRSLAKDPALRFQTAGELKAALAYKDADAQDYEPAKEGPPPQVEASFPDRRANFWISERELDSRVPLEKGALYTGNFRVGSHVPANLIISGQTTIPDSDVPPEGLKTSWVVAALNIEFESIDNTTVATNFVEGAAASWSIRFALLIPKVGDSETIQFRIRPLARNASFVAYVYVRTDLYREFHVKLSVEEAKSNPEEPDGPQVVITDDFLITAPGHLNLKATHQWTTPSGEITVNVSGQNKGAVRSTDGIDDDYPMNTDSALISGTIMNVRLAADEFRLEFSDDLNDISPSSLGARLSRQFQPHYNWSTIRDFADKKHRRRWNAIATSKKLLEFAFQGRQLYNAIFPRETDLRGFLDAAPPGHRINIIWRPTSGPPWVRVPWGLMYRGEVRPDIPVDPMEFWGLRYRLGYSAYPTGSPSNALGKLRDSWCTNFLFYGNDSHDPATKEARWQKKSWGAWEKQFIVPSGTKPAPRKQITDELSTPTRKPTSVVYIFCRCTAGKGNMPELQFVSEEDRIRHFELGTADFAEHPLVFANACVTSAAEPQIVNELERSFFERKCRSYIGTETRVPVQMAGRFASVFFHFFYRLMDSKPMKAGEAISQARLFLWSHYKNIGGLFYTQLNHYDLYMASEAEIKSLRQW